MTMLTCKTEISLTALPTYIDRITSRLMSFQATLETGEQTLDFAFPFGRARFDMPGGRLTISAEADNADRLARLKDILATAVELYGKAENPKIVWQGDLSDQTKLAQFRLIEVISTEQLTPHMRRIRFAGEDLERFASFGGMHVRLLFPTPEVPAPVWPILGANGLPSWPDESARPTARVYTIRHLDMEAGHVDIDFVVHGDHSIGSSWAIHAEAGNRLGMMGPLGRPVPKADWHLMGSDETGIPALSRILGALPAATRGYAFVEVESAAEEQAIVHDTAMEIVWIHRNGSAAGTDERLTAMVCAIEWPEQASRFGWFAGEASAAKKVREHWRDTLGLGRDQTLAAGYWRIGASGVMAG